MIHIQFLVHKSLIHAIKNHAVNHYFRGVAQSGPVDESEIAHEDPRHHAKGVIVGISAFHHERADLRFGI
jgi:hypothetical protein